ncbi:hypothetical protein [Pedobacter helvus]|uniref:Uncharacterized protein n=1 Tax=Pedobacter helvus TaxID=2563444 RepID=A0ABW9JLH5_9SPHI|nr:hypothetical protein [Pedobacter ureilyticus]
MKQNNHKQLDIISQVLTYFAIGSLFFLAIGLKDIDNYFNWLLFSITMIASGMLIAATLYTVLGMYNPDVKTYKNKKGVGLFFPLAFGFSLTFFGLGGIVNEAPNQNRECKEYIIQELGESGSSRKAYYVFITNDENKLERLSFGKAFNKNHKAGDKINLCIITGSLGFKYYKINILT